MEQGGVKLRVCRGAGRTHPLAAAPVVVGQVPAGAAPASAGSLPPPAEAPSAPGPAPAEPPSEGTLVRSPDRRHVLPGRRPQLSRRS